MSSNMIPSRGLFLSACALVVGLSSAGCMQKPLCDDLSDCGGPEPMGTYQLSPGHPSCLEDLYVPVTDPRLKGAEIQPARSPAIEPALYDWCYQLIVGGDQDFWRRDVRFYYESGPIGWASITYKGLNPMTGVKEYTLGTARTGTYIFDFPAVCMRSFGATDGQPPRDLNDNPMGEPTSLCKQLQLPLSQAGMSEGAYQNVICEANPAEPEGCLCQFDVSETGGGSGTYEIVGKTIRHEPTGTSNFPQIADYCNKGPSLELTGHDGNYLFGTKGLRTMDLQKVEVNCTDGVQGPGETGVDCGGGCPNPCPM
jgi:hypothetical protein